MNQQAPEYANGLVISPALSKSFQLKKDKKQGWILVATEDIQPDTNLFVDRNYFSCFDAGNMHSESPMNGLLKPNKRNQLYMLEALSRLRGYQANLMSLSCSSC